MANTFGAGSDLFTFADTDWDLVKTEYGARKDYAQSRSGADEVLADQDYNDRDEASCTYRAKSVGTLAIALDLGLEDTTSDYVPLSLSVRTTNTGFAEVTITGHKHPAAHNVNSESISLSVTGWGATDFLGDPANDGCQSSSQTIAINHVDKLDFAGDFLCGRSQSLKYDAEASYISDTVPTLAAGWSKDSDDSGTGADFYTAALKAHKFSTP